jgi:hypothetical protein
MRLHPILLLLLAPLTSTALGAAAPAQGGSVDTNRRVASVSKIAQPDGSTVLHAAVQTQLFTPGSAPRDLSMNVEFRINGAPVGTVFVPAQALGGGTCPTATYLPCGGSVLGPAGCALDVPTSSGGVCSASGLASLPVPAGTIHAGDVLTAHLSPAAGALPELDTTDDKTAAGDGMVDAADYAIWRSNFGQTASQSAGGDSFFDIWVEIELGTDGTAPVDLATLVEVEVDGVVAASKVVQSFADHTRYELALLPSVPCPPGAEVLVLLRPAPGALPTLPGLEPEPMPVPLLLGDVGAISVSAGGKQTLTLSAGAAHAGDVYLILGSLSGTAPGLPIAPFLLPLNPDPYFFHTLNHPNQSPLVNTLGVLDAAGEATAAFQLGFASPPGLSGLTLHHAAVLLDPVSAKPTGVTNAVKLLLL